MAASEIQLFQVLKNKLGERETEALLHFVNEKITENNKEQHEKNLRVLATKEDIFLVKEDIFLVKEDIAMLRGEIGELKGEIKGEIGALRVEFKGELGMLRAEFKGELETKIAQSKSDIVRWVFAFFVTLMLAIAGLYFKH